MAETKYGKYLIEGPFITIDHYTGTSIVAHDGEYDADVSIGLHCLADTRFKAEFPHSHDFHELLCFIGGNPLDITDFGAEIELSLGEEGEVHVISSTTVVSIPPGLVHCPLIVKRCDKPVSFLEISLTRKWPPMSEMLEDIPPDQRHKIPPALLKKMEEEKKES